MTRDQTQQVPLLKLYLINIFLNNKVDKIHYL